MESRSVAWRAAERHLGVRVFHQVLSDPIDILRNHGIFDHARGLFELCRHLSANGDFLLERDEIRKDSPDAPRDVAVAYALNVAVPAIGVARDAKEQRHTDCHRH